MSNAKPPVANTPATVLIPEDLDIAIKILVVGNGSVGKSSMIHRYCKGGYNDAYVKTIGVDYLEKEVKVPGVDSSVRLMLWDTAGQEEFDSITREYYYEANAVALVFSTTDRSSFETIRSWRSKVQSVCRDIPMVLVQNKVDLIHKTVVTNQDGEALARDLHVKFYRVSVKDNVNLEEVFQYLAELYVKRMKEQHQAITIATALASQSVGEDTKYAKGKAKSQSGRENSTNGPPSAKSWSQINEQSAPLTRPATAATEGNRVKDFGDTEENEEMERSVVLEKTDVDTGGQNLRKNSSARSRPGTAGAKKDCVIS